MNLYDKKVDGGCEWLKYTLSVRSEVERRRWLKDCLNN